MSCADSVIALVDDDAPVRSMLGRVLRTAGYQVVAFETGEHFLASLDAQVPDCAVLDIHMPGLTGLDVQARMEASHPKVPVILVTASDEALLESAARVRGTPLLRKPFGTAELIAAVAGALAAAAAD